MNESREPQDERVGAQEGSPGLWTVARAQAALGETVEELLRIADALKMIHDNLPPPADLKDRQEHRKPYDVATEILATIDCVLADDLQPAIRGLQRAARITETELQVEFLSVDG
ncbi:MAG TPA: hypothetical protein VGS22_02140 [Thermoanaerobaculia bacterium]|nr:hypothetical protein [Thermoanaerobaculia bacterium]